MPQVVGGGRWVWRDETNTLEIIGGSNVSFTEPGVSRVQKRAKVAEKRRERDRTTPLMPFVAGSLTSALSKNSYRERFTNLPHTITLNDIKAVAMSQSTVKLDVSPEVVSSIYESPLVEDIIITTLVFFDSFFAAEESMKPKPMMALMPSLSEPSAEELERVREESDKLVTSHKRLSAVYGAFLLGLGAEELHHLNAGKLRYSKTRKDKEFFEALYECLILCTWLCFEQSRYNEINSEMGRLFRSDSFNINKRQVDLKDEDPKYTPSPAEYRRTRSKKTPFGKAINMQSPMVEGMLKTSNIPPQYIGTVNTNIRVGIIGQPIRDFDLKNLKRLEEKDKKEMSESYNPSRASSAVGSEQG